MPSHDGLQPRGMLCGRGGVGALQPRARGYARTRMHGSRLERRRGSRDAASGGRTGLGCINIISSGSRSVLARSTCEPQDTASCWLRAAVIRIRIRLHLRPLKCWGALLGCADLGIMESVCGRTSLQGGMWLKWKSYGLHMAHVYGSAHVHDSRRQALSCSSCACEHRGHHAWPYMHVAMLAW